jgi:hypothetical protein
MVAPAAAGITNSNHLEVPSVTGPQAAIRGNSDWADDAEAAG